LGASTCSLVTPETILERGVTLKGAGEEVEGVEDRDVVRDSRRHGLVGLESSDSGRCSPTAAAAGRDCLKTYNVPSFEPITVPLTVLLSTSTPSEGSPGTPQDLMTHG